MAIYMVSDVFHRGMLLLLLVANSWRRFGVVYLTLQLVPVLSMFFLLTSACGSALWVADIEAEKERLAHIVIRDAEADNEHDSTLPQYRDSVPAEDAV